MDTEVSEEIAPLIKYIEENTTLDGTYRVALLKTVAAYYESLIHAESMNAILMKTFSNLQ
jgi:hypothetical protein